MFPATCCYLLVFAAGCCWLLLFPAICCCLLLLAMNAMNRCNFVAKFTSSCCCLTAFAYVSLCNGLSPKSTPDGPKIDHLGTLKSLQNHSKIIKNRLTFVLGASWDIPPANWALIWKLGVDFWSILGTPWDPQNSPKSPLGPKSSPRDRIFIEFCCTHRFIKFCYRFCLVFA